MRYYVYAGMVIGLFVALLVSAILDAGGCHSFWVGVASGFAHSLIGGVGGWAVFMAARTGVSTI